MMTAARCRACNAEIGWALTDANHKPIPLDPRPSPAGNVALRRGEVEGRVVALAEVLAGAELERIRSAGEVPLFVPHFATCPGWPARRSKRRDVGPKNFKGKVTSDGLQPTRLPENVVQLAGRRAR